MDRRNLRLAGAVAVVFLLFHGTATWLGSDRGQAGLWVGLIVVVATGAAERLIDRTPWRAIPAALGLGSPSVRGIVIAVALSAVLLAVMPVFALAMVAAATIPFLVFLVPRQLQSFQGDSRASL